MIKSDKSQWIEFDYNKVYESYYEWSYWKYFGDLDYKSETENSINLIYQSINLISKSINQIIRAHIEKMLMIW